ncbi:uncharacterized protein [Elaeis guineensis]|uniref:YTH domain-containing family protein n=1 Tax=Elaeis guineensis var. tenera TaxID=51953 RepID=A0A8N4I5T5_ELAGV|nr:uncharacterized protein LOC105032538 [Elaeis guineensis]
MEDLAGKDQGVKKHILVEAIVENVSVVDSSLTEGKHDLENSDDQEGSFDKDNKEYNASTRGARFHRLSGADSSSLMHNEKNTTRYFIMKSLSHQNMQLSIEKGIWATQVMNEPLLEEAYLNSDKSGGGNNPWGHTFKVKWLQLHNLPFQKTLHLKNPLNDYKPVKISRDCQEISKDVGEALCGLFDEADGKCKLKRNYILMDDIIPKRPCRNFPVHLQDEDCMLSVPSSNLRFSGATVLDPPFYQHVQHGECSYFWKPKRSCRISSPSNLESRTISRMKLPRVDGNLDGRQTDKDIIDERNIPVSFSEDDILNMVRQPPSINMFNMESAATFGSLKDLAGSLHHQTWNHERSLG